MSLNKVMLIGNVGKDPEVRYLERNGKVASFRLATNEYFRDREGRQREFTEWHGIVTWNGNADFVEKYVKKGSLLYIEGKIRTRSWTDRSGTQKTSTDIFADSIQLLGRNPENRVNTAGQDAAGPAERKLEKTDAARSMDFSGQDDGLPF